MAEPRKAVESAPLPELGEATPEEALMEWLQCSDNRMLAKHQARVAAVCEPVDINVAVETVMPVWTTKCQAVFNILFTAPGVPNTALAMELIMRGLGDEREEAYVLAAAMGLKAMPAAVLEEQKEDIVKALFQTIVRLPTPTALHVFMAGLTVFSHPEHTPPVAWASVAHPELGVRIEALQWLMMNIPRCSPEEFRAFVQSADATPFGADPLTPAHLASPTFDKYVSKYGEVWKTAETPEDVRKMFSSVDHLIPSFTEFRVWRLFPGIPAHLLENITDVFRELDSDADGRVSAADIDRVYKDNPRMGPGVEEVARVTQNPSAVDFGLVQWLKSCITETMMQMQAQRAAGGGCKKGCCGSDGAHGGAHGHAHGHAPERGRGRGRSRGRGGATGSAVAQKPATTDMM